MNENILVHYGIKGMKWGIRRYQNADGSLTTAGRQHYNVGKARNKNNQYPSDDEMQKTVKRKSLEKAYDKAIDRKDLSDIANTTSDTSNKLSSSMNKARNARQEYKRSKLPPIDTSKMTTRELQEAVNRMNLENNYVRLVNDRALVKQGRDWVDVAIDSMDEVAYAAAIVASIAKVVDTVMKFK